ncbi:MAG: polyprenyl synthetase family protein [Pseudomonadota bacterium]|jgi:octaprenyl-diphosphate synthase|nr:polyprenyl synthetase family protein [Pseudomonadota bacterium]HNU84950.1 polyprenyl synthetase family protein [Syntrophales bacterium]HNZ34222.1 polyprenyl synthetase family protein [Syntrophales bacterium]HOF72964.1 polyprenyl synthetase family protein [Syntrophales bacterium]HOH44505.1 polyprenyl synthetase family protein [Syntrophales bacterium]
MNMTDVLRRYEPDLRQVEEHLGRYLHSEIPFIPQVINHLISSGGKRFRPLMLLASADLCGYRGERRYPLSAVIEFIHTATLLHDDVVDGAETRRGRPSANNVWGNASVVLVGDFLYSRSFTLMTRDGDLAIIQLISETTNTMAEGEVFQLLKCGDAGITEEDYFTLIEKKTAVLIAAACAVGALMAGASPDRVEALRAFGHAMGLAFQLTDDTLDYVAAEKEFGKAIGMDIREGKITLPLIRTLARCTAGEKETIRGIVERKQATDEDIAAVFGLIGKYDGIPYALDRARTIIADGKARLAPFRDGEAKAALLAMADFIAERTL